MLPSGELSVLGRYDVTEGEYSLTYQVLKRQFAIEKGSSITFTGDPLKALVDITAVYRTTALASDLLASENQRQTTNRCRSENTLRGGAENWRQHSDTKIIV